jgi:hypothetical protein
MRRFITGLFTIILLLLVIAACARPFSVDFRRSATPAVTITSPPPGPTSAATITLPPPDPDESAPIWITNPVDRTLLRIDPLSGKVVATILIEGHPDVAVAGEGAVWVLDRAYNIVFRVDPVTNRVATSIPLPAGNSEALAVGAGAVWVGVTGRIDLSEQAPGQEEEIMPPAMVVQIDPKTNRFDEQFPVQPVGRLQISGSTLWVLSRAVIDTPLQVINLDTKQGLAVPLYNAPAWLPIDAIAVDPGNLWLLSAAYGKIFHGTPNGRINSLIDLGQRQPTGYADLLLTRSGLWAATPWGTVLQIDPRTNHIDATIDLNVPLTRLIAGGGSVWAFSQQNATLFRIDPASKTVTTQVATGSLMQPTGVPSPTARVVIWKPCPDAPTSRLKVGDIAYVTKDPPIPNRVRQEPNRKAEILGLINPGGSMEILAGPTCADNWVWWHVKNADLNGWMAEGDAETYWMVPLYK